MIGELIMSFFQGLKQIERFLTNIVDAIAFDTNDAQLQRPFVAPHVQNPALRSLSSVSACASVTASSVTPTPSTCTSSILHQLSSNGNATATTATASTCTQHHASPSQSQSQLPEKIMNFRSQSDFMIHYTDILDSLLATIAAHENKNTHENADENTNVDSIIPSIPLELQHKFFMAMRQDMNSKVLAQKAQTALLEVTLIEKGKDDSNINAIAEAKAKEHLQDMVMLVQQSEEASLELGSQILNRIDNHFLRLRKKGGNKRERGYEHDHEQNPWDMPLLQSTILSLATPKQLAVYSAKSYAHATQVHNLLQNLRLMKDILWNGGPKQNNFGRMLEIYHGILDLDQASYHNYHDVDGDVDGDDSTRSRTCTSNIFEKLALAVALEHAVPIHVFDTKVEVNPIERYIHYRDAYIQRELDPHFSTLTIWELRMVIDCNASNDEIQWCRDMLRNYRPDHILERNDNDKWKYCMIVKTDVRYKRPEWASDSPRTYQQILSGGGMCGPRAWFGRFVVKSWGVPSWGVRQPGHAAMSRWTSSGKWEICLGGPNWKKSHWDGRNGVDFEIETMARRRHEEYSKVFILDCLANIHREPTIGSQHWNYNGRKVEDRFFRELSTLQKKVLAKSNVRLDSCPSNEIEAFAGLIVNPMNGTFTCLKTEVGEIFIPASACSACSTCASRSTRSSNAILMKSFDGDTHIHLKENGIVDYSFTVDITGTYMLYAKVVTVHASPKHIKVKVIDNDGCESNLVMNVPNTNGQWGSTLPIKLDLKKGLNQLQIDRSDGLGITVKGFCLKRTDQQHSHEDL